MAPLVHCVRHAQGWHNSRAGDTSMVDPALTPKGISQCHNLGSKFPDQSRIAAIVASPLKRTIYTALKSFVQAIASRNAHIIALPDLQETSDLPCDIGSPLEELRQEFDGLPVDFSNVPEGWEKKEGRWASSSSRIVQRATEARRRLKDMSETIDGEIVVVTHGGFLHYLTDDWDDFEFYKGTGWSNTEYRTYEFGQDDSGTVSLVETAESRERRKASEKVSTFAEQRELIEAAMNPKKKLGFQKNESTPFIRAKV